MKKKLLTLTFTLILLIGLVAALGMNASAADVDCTANGNIYEVDNGNDLRLYLSRADDGDTIRLSQNIVVRSESGNFEIEPMRETSKVGDVILDLNGCELYVAAINSYLFDLAEVNNVALHIVNSHPVNDGWIRFISPQIGSSVFYLGSSNNKLYIYEGVSVKMGIADTPVSGNQATYIINAGSYGEIGIHGAYLENLYTSGKGLYFNNNSINMRNSKVYIDGGAEIKTKSSCIDLHNSSYYPDFQIGAAILDGNNAVEVIEDNQNANATEKDLKFKDLLQDGYNLYMVDGSGTDCMNEASLLNNADTADCYIYKGAYGDKCPTHESKKDVFVYTEGHLTQCTDCGYSAGLSKHTQVSVKDATCTATGYSKAGYDCACGRLTATVIPALGHDIITVEAKEPTCTKDGSTSDYKKCTRCNAKYDINGAPMMPGYWNSMYKKALGHDMVKVAAKAATCTKNGNIAHYDCSRCDLITSDADGKNAITTAVEKAKGHKYTNACDTTCNTCSAKRSITHSYNAATCTKAKTCKVCGATSGSKLGHKYSNSCDTTCNTCKATRKITHSYKTTSTTKATLTKNGKVASKCSVCGATKTTTVYYPKTFKLSKTSFNYNGKVQTPSVTIKDTKGNTLKKDTDYTVKYSSGRKAIGKYTVTITFKGKYTGSKKLTYTIVPKTTSKVTASQTTTSVTLKWNKVTGATGYRVFQKVDGKWKTLTNTSKLTYTIKKLKTGTKYTFAVRPYTVVSKTTFLAATYTQIGTATKTATPTLKVSSSKKGVAALSWTNVAGETGYQVYYSTKKDSGYKSLASYKGNVVKGSKTGLTSKKTYYFKVRAYTKTDSGTVYSAWSAVKSIKIK